MLDGLKVPGATPLLAAAGGIRADNVAELVEAGADMIVTSAPYAAPPADVSVSLEALNT